MTRIAVVGLGKMGLSHVSMIRPHPDVELVGVCDSMGYVLDVLNKYTGVPTYTDAIEMYDKAKPEGVIIATPTHLHGPMIRAALERGIHVFCEKPLVLDPQEGLELAELARERGLVTQVGYHNRHVGAFQEVKRLLDLGAIGEVNTVLAQAYGPVVLKPAGRSWRSRRNTGGGALYDYAAHPLDLLTWYLGEPTGVDGAQMTSIFSKDIDDAVSATIRYPKATATLNVNWSDESQRKMSTRMTLWGNKGRIYADRQEIQVYFFEGAEIPEGYEAGWNVRYTTELSDSPFFYVRGEEYSGQLDHFVRRIRGEESDGLNTFESASVTDRLISSIATAAQREETVAWRSVDEADDAGTTATATRGSRARGLDAFLPREQRAALRRDVSAAARSITHGVKETIQRKRQS